MSTHKIRSIIILVIFTALVTAERFMMPVYTFSLLTSFVGLVALGLFFHFVEFSKEGIGITYARKTLLPSLAHGLLVSVLAIVLEMGLEEILWLSRGNHGLFFSLVTDIRFSSAEASTIYYAGLPTFLKWAVGGILICLVRSAFYEMGFRGYLICEAAEQYGVRKGNRIQAIEYAIMAGAPSVVMIARMIPLGSFKGFPLWVVPVTVIVLFLNMYILGVRQGKLRACSGSIWICVISYLVLDYYNIAFKADSIFPAYLIPFVPIYRGLAVQVMASVVNIPVTGFFRHRFKSKTENSQSE